ncbi:hypothetical protein Tco_0710663 [Tanacetum coccineum]
MNLVAAQQVDLDNALVAPKKRLKIEKCNMRIKFNKPQREPTFQNTIKKIKDTDAYEFKLDKQKFRVDTEVFREILQIYSKLPNQDFVKPPSDEEMVPFIKELGYTGKCDMLSEIHTDQMHQPWRTFAAVINRCISEKSTAIKDSKEYKTYLDFETGEATPKKARKFKKIASPSKKQTLILEEEPAKKPKRVKHPEPAKESAPAKRDAGLLEVDQLKKVLKHSRKETHSHQASGSGDGVGSQPKVLDELQDKTTESRDDDDSNDEDSDDDSNDDDSDDDEEYEEEYVHTPENYESTDDENEHIEEEEYDLIDEELYKDVNVKLKDAEHGEEGKGDA